MVKILQRDETILRNTAEHVSREMFGSKKLTKIISDMKTALASQADGVAIAAPQIGVPLRMFVVSGKILDYLSRAKKDHEDEVFINPKLTKLSKEKKYMEEGCLSVRYLYGKVKRSTKVQLEAHDENGKTLRKGASGVLAQIFQHETDHLEGILFTDKAKDLEEIPPEVLKEFQDLKSKE